MRPNLPNAKYLIEIAAITAFMLILGCGPQPLSRHDITTKPLAQTYPTRPTTPPPPFKLFHQSPNTITLVTSESATDDQITAILWQLRDAAQTHTFDRLHIPQKLVDARDPMIWFHLYRGPKCAAEKYAPGAPPCGPSYHAAGDYTLGGTHNPNWDSGVLLTPSNTDQPHETQLWPPGSPYVAPH